jgi:hypothetical protein
MTAQGVFYGQCMTRLMESVIEQGAEWILTIDGDSWFTADQLRHLMTVFHNRTDIDALAAWQEWAAANNSLYILPTCRIGHLEEMVSLIGSDGKTTHVYPSDFTDKE